jgi:hypothetical protein
MRWENRGQPALRSLAAWRQQEGCRAGWLRWTSEEPAGEEGLALKKGDLRRENDEAANPPSLALS